MLRGTIDRTIISPRDLVAAALSAHAAAVIFAHNHPSGIAELSGTDLRLTMMLSKALTVVGIEVVYHLVIGDGVCESLAEEFVPAPL